MWLTGTVMNWKIGMPERNLRSAPDGYLFYLLLKGIFHLEVGCLFNTYNAGSLAKEQSLKVWSPYDPPKCLKIGLGSMPSANFCLLPPYMAVGKQHLSHGDDDVNLPASIKGPRHVMTSSVALVCVYISRQTVIRGWIKGWQRQTHQALYLRNGNR